MAWGRKHTTVWQRSDEQETSARNKGRFSEPSRPYFCDLVLSLSHWNGTFTLKSWIWMVFLFFFTSFESEMFFAQVVWRKKIPIGGLWCHCPTTSEISLRRLEMKWNLSDGLLRKQRGPDLMSARCPPEKQLDSHDASSRRSLHSASSRWTSVPSMAYFKGKQQPQKQASLLLPESLTVSRAEALMLWSEPDVAGVWKGTRAECGDVTAELIDRDQDEAGSHMSWHLSSSPSWIIFFRVSRSAPSTVRAVRLPPDVCVGCTALW